MDMPQHDEDVVLGLDPLDVVEHVLTAENLEFDRTEDGDLAFTLAGDWKDYEMWFAWRPEADCLQLCLAVGHVVTKSQRPAAHELVG
ncbi:MAG TPA: YbjN domain-containing protein, partial [Phenylobacterium sp.]|nr:YbjN domain-containing protein [Phenylobacterium sp.]